MAMRRYRLAITTDAAGAATAYTPRTSGRVHAIEYVKNDFANGVDFAVTSEATGLNIWSENDVNASAVRYPRQPTHSAAGVASLYAAAGTAVQAMAAIAADRVKVVIAQGGNTKSGVVHVLVDE